MTVRTHLWNRKAATPQSPEGLEVSPQSGIVMVAMMILFGSITLLSISAFVFSSTDVLVAGYYSQSRNSFFEAEAGLQAIKSQVNDDLSDGTLVLDSAVESVNYTAPSGFNFNPVTVLTRLADTNSYYFTVTGRTVNAKTVLEVTLSLRNLLGYAGVFGHQDVTGQPNGGIYSYYSGQIPTPLPPGDSTGEAAVGSNHDVGLSGSLILDGAILLGEDSSGQMASYSAGPGIPAEEVGEAIDSDPLGAVGGEVEQATQFFSQSSNNNNADAVPPIVGNSVQGSIYLPPGNYYLEDFVLGALDVLELGGTAENPVVIYFEGQKNNDQFLMQPNSDMTFTAGDAVPTAFYLFSVTDHDIQIQPNQDFYGLVYAPEAEVRLQPNGDIHGVFWGDVVRAQPGGDIWVDLSLLDQFTSDIVEISQWKELRQP
jgi:hypothetical protein